jgi:nucleotide-binding universal stress UspA family protein
MKGHGSDCFTHEGHQRRKLGRWREAVSTGAICALGDTMNRLALRHVLCPMDLSPLSMNSLEWANAIARVRNAELRAFHVAVSEGLDAPGGLGSAERGDMMTNLREALVAVDPDNDLTGAAVRHGDPGTQILRFARSGQADVIVMGAAGAQRPTRPMGSVSATVVAFRLPRSDHTHRTANRSIKSRRVQTDSVCSRPSAIFRERHQAGALTRMGDTWTRHMRVRDDRTESVFVRNPEPVIGGDPS